MNNLHSQSTQIMDYEKLQRNIIYINPTYLVYIEKAKMITGVHDHNLHLVWGYVDLLMDDPSIDEINKELEPFYKLIECIKPDRDVMHVMDKFYHNNIEEFESSVYWRDEYDYPLHGDYIEELDGIVNYNGFMTFTIRHERRRRHRRYRANDNNQ